MAVALKLNDGIDYVLKHFWPGNGTFLVDVTDENHRSVGLFGKLQQLSGTLTHLSHRTSR